jgi:tRNA threonylcarbamoyladenosine biosynthesis protein TsaE
MSKWMLVSKSALQTEFIGESVGQKLKGGEIIELSSDLGGGKTTLTKGIAKGLGISENVSSPTFTLSKIYKGNYLELHHYDFFRLTNLGIMSEELEEVIENVQNVTVVEWAGKARYLFPKERTIRVKLKVQKNLNHRKLFFELPNGMDKLISTLGAKKC